MYVLVLFVLFFFFNDPATTEIYTLSLHDALPIYRCLIGMGAILMDGATIGEDCIVAAGALVVERTIVPPNTLMVGSPARPKRPLTDDELQWIKTSANNYLSYVIAYQDG